MLLETLALEGDAIMADELIGAFRASRRKIGRTSANNAADQANPGGNEAAVGQLADPDCEVDMIFHKINHPVGLHHPDADIPIELEEIDGDGAAWTRPNTIGVVMIKSPLGALNSPVAARSASSKSSRMFLQAAT